MHVPYSFRTGVNELLRTRMFLATILQQSQLRMGHPLVYQLLRPYSILVYTGAAC